MTKMLETRLECDHHPYAPVSSAFGASASKTFSPSCGLLDLVQAARVYVKLYEQFHDSACTSSISFSVCLPQNVWELCLLELLCAWLPRHSTQSHSRDCSTAEKGVIGGHNCKRHCYVYRRQDWLPGKDSLLVLARSDFASQHPSRKHSKCQCQLHPIKERCRYEVKIAPRRTATDFCRMLPCSHWTQQNTF